DNAALVGDIDQQPGVVQERSQRDLAATVPYRVGHELTDKQRRGVELVIRKLAREPIPQQRTSGTRSRGLSPELDFHHVILPCWFTTSLVVSLPRRIHCLSGAMRQSADVPTGGAQIGRGGARANRDPGETLGCRARRTVGASCSYTRSSAQSQGFL